MLSPYVNTEVTDFFDRHADAIAKAIIPKPFVHTCPCPPGKRLWRFSWRWPFVHTWISKAICCCDINWIMSARRSDELLGEIVEALSSTRHGYDLYADFLQESRGPAAPVGQATQNEKAQA